MYMTRSILKVLKGNRKYGNHRQKKDKVYVG